MNDSDTAQFQNETDLVRIVIPAKAGISFDPKIPNTRRIDTPCIGYCNKKKNKKNKKKKKKQQLNPN
jgi:hypothetical protein